MVTIDDMTSAILEMVLPAARMTAEDAAVLASHRDLLLSMEDGLVAAFYDTAYGHEPTAAVFEEGERPAREETLVGWWRKTVEGPIDDDYFRWMTLVGLVHVRRGVRNPMMISMTDVVVAHVVDEARATLGPDETAALQRALDHLFGTIGSLIAEAYTMSFVSALQDIAGLDPKLSTRLVSMEVKGLEDAARAGRT